MIFERINGFLFNFKLVSLKSLNLATASTPSVVSLYVIFWNGSLSMGDSEGMMSSEVNMWTHMMILVTFLAVFVYDFLYDFDVFV